MKNTAQNIDQVVTGAQGRFISILVGGKGLNIQSYSGKVERMTDSFIYFTDYNDENKSLRKVKQESVLRVSCGLAIYSKRGVK